MLKESGARAYLDEQEFPYLLIDRDGAVSGTLNAVQ